MEVACVDRLNLLELAPGGHLGRFCIWTKAAVEKMDSIFGTHSAASSVKKGYVLPRAIMTNADVSRHINSDELQSVVKAPKKDHKVAHGVLKRNPLTNKKMLDKLNAYAATQRKAAREAKKTHGKGDNKISKAFYKQLKVESEYEGEDFEGFNTWLGTNAQE